MPKPKPYPSTDETEQASITNVRSLINDKYIKLDLREKDKFPNSDGIIEIVDENGVPIGKVDVQIRTFDSEKMKATCETAIVAYSETSTLPVLFIGSDPKNKRAFWKHISPNMPEYKEDQDSFTLYFSKEADEIHEKSKYIQKWTDVILDYRRRISEYPFLSNKLSERLTLDDIEKKYLEFFQRFINRANILIGSDFIGIRRIIYPGVWMLGVAVFAHDNNLVTYRLIGFQQGEPSPPLICKLQGDLIKKREWRQSDLYQVTTAKDNLEDPEEEAEELILKQVRKVIDQRALSVHSELMATDIVIDFIERYPDILDISPDKESYSIDEINNAINNRLIELSASFANLINQDTDIDVMVDLDILSRYIQRNDEIKFPKIDSPIRFSIYSNKVSIKGVFDSLRFLQSIEKQSIRRVFPIPKPPTETRSWYIWEGFSKEEEINAIRKILLTIIDEYEKFTKGNRLTFPDSPYLDSNIAFIFEFNLATGNDNKGPILNTYQILNPSPPIPRINVLVDREEKERLTKDKFPIIEFDGNNYEVYSSSHSACIWMYQSTPISNFLYRFLEDDLSKHYQNY